MDCISRGWKTIWRSSSGLPERNTPRTMPASMTRRSSAPQRPITASLKYAATSGKLPASATISLQVPPSGVAPKRTHQVVSSSRNSRTGWSCSASTRASHSSMRGSTDSSMTARNRASLLSKYRYSVPFETPARAATSSRRVAAKPLSTNRARAAAASSAGRASLRRWRDEVSVKSI